MDGSACLNCGDADAEEYDLQIRNTDHEGVALCDACHASIQRELAD